MKEINEAILLFISAVIGLIVFCAFMLLAVFTDYIENLKRKSKNANIS